jgi:hypothetical protein
VLEILGASLKNTHTCRLHLPHRAKVGRLTGAQSRDSLETLMTVDLELLWAKLSTDFSA